MSIQLSFRLFFCSSRICFCCIHVYFIPLQFWLTFLSYYSLPFYFNSWLRRGSAVSGDHSEHDSNTEDDPDIVRGRERERGSKVIEGGSVIRGGPSPSQNDDNGYDDRRNQNDDSDEEHTQVRGFKRRQPQTVKVKAKDQGSDSMDSFKPRESGKTGGGFLDDDSDDSEIDKMEIRGLKTKTGRGGGRIVGIRISDSDSDDNENNLVTRKTASSEKGRTPSREAKEEGEEIGKKKEGESDGAYDVTAKAAQGKECMAADVAGAPTERRGMLKKVTKKRVAAATSVAAGTGELLPPLST